MVLNIVGQIKPYFIFLILGCYVLGIFLFVHPSSPLPFNPEGITIVGRVIEEPEAGKESFVLQTQINQKWLIKPKRHSLKFLIRYGDTIQVKGNQTWPITTNPGQFDYGLFLSRKHIRGMIRAQSICILATHGGNPFIKSALFLHHRIVVLHRSLFPHPYADLLTSLVFGDHGIALSEDLQENFQKTGLTHLLVVSGSQVAFLAGMIALLLNSFALSSRLVFGLVSIVSVCFFFLTGGGSSVLRAVLMSEISLGLSLIQRKTSAYHILALTIIIMLTIDPMMLWDIGAQLSCLATFSLMFGVPKVESVLPKQWPVFFQKLVAVSVTPIIFSMPLIWFYFQNLSPWAFISNLIVLSWVEILVGVGFLGALLGLVYAPLALIPTHFCWILMKILTAITTFFANCPGSVLSVSKPSFVEITLLYICLLGLGAFYKKNNKHFLVSGIGMGLLIIWIVLVRVWPSPYLKVTFIDVGQGDSILIETPSRKTILIDAGDLTKDYQTKDIVFDNGKSTIAPLLRYKGINHLDSIVVSHFHADHIGGMLYLLTKFPINMAIDNGIKDPDFPRYFSLIQQHHVRHKKAVQGDILHLDHGIYLQIIYPEKNLEPLKNKNNTSVCLKLIYNKVSFLLTGDLEEEKEAELVDRYGANLHATVLKLGHHGSKTSSTDPFLRAVHPQYAVMSVGRENRFGHPNQEVVKKLSTQHIPILRTDQDGAIEWITDGKSLAFKKYMQHGLAK